MRRPLILLSALLATPLIGCGGSDEGRPARPTVATAQALDECAMADQRVSAGWEFQTIVDFERPPGDTKSKWRSVCAPEVNCGFYFNYDSITSPRPGSPCAEALGVNYRFDDLVGVPFATPLGEPRCGVSEAAYNLNVPLVASCVNGKGRLGWGATLAITLNVNPKDSGQAIEGYDASAWDGISFWVRVGEGPSNQALLAAAKDPFSSRRPLMPEGLEDYCRSAENASDAEKCDSFGRAVLLESEWRFVAIPFELMKQKGFGVPSPTGTLNVAELVGFELGFSAGNWDMWFDDLAFYREPH